LLAMQETSEKGLPVPYCPCTNGHEKYANGWVIGKSRQYHASTRKWNSPVDLGCLNASGAEHACENVEGMAPGCKDNAIHT
jgi:hypothetical protein